MLVDLTREFYNNSELVKLLHNPNESNQVDYIGMRGMDEKNLWVDVYKTVALDYIRNRFKYNLEDKSLEVVSSEFVFPFNRVDKEEYEVVIES